MSCAASRKRSIAELAAFAANHPHRFGSPQTSSVPNRTVNLALSRSTGAGLLARKSRREGVADQHAMERRSRGERGRQEGESWARRMPGLGFSGQLGEPRLQRWRTN
jgi:hypothetical protein